jgi:hypothetical protein
MPTGKSAVPRGAALLAGLAAPPPEGRTKMPQGSCRRMTAEVEGSRASDLPPRRGCGGDGHADPMPRRHRICKGHCRHLYMAEGPTADAATRCRGPRCCGRMQGGKGVGRCQRGLCIHREESRSRRGGGLPCHDRHHRLLGGAAARRVGEGLVARGRRCFGQGYGSWDR